MSEKFQLTNEDVVPFEVLRHTSTKVQLSVSRVNPDPPELFRSLSRVSGTHFIGDALFSLIDEEHGHSNLHAYLNELMPYLPPDSLPKVVGQLG